MRILTTSRTHRGASAGALCFFAVSARSDGAQEIVEQALTVRRRRIRRRRAVACGLLDEVAEALARGVEAFEEEGIDGGVARGELRGVQVPALIEAAGERVLDVVVVDAPGAVDGATVFVFLCGRERRPVCRAVRGDGHDVGAPSASNSPVHAKGPAS